ncbi:MAG: hypothetical protein HYS88_00325 [Candidatus Colwellbacteria bacterium]|nr:hypothetical protein [Candidatus Colwellbacteria bacterium]
MADYPVRQQKKQKPKIDLVLSLRESMRRGEKTELQEDYNLRGTQFFTVIPTTDPWSTPLQALPVSPQSGDILILTEEDELDDIWNVVRPPEVQLVVESCPKWPQTARGWLGTLRRPHDRWGRQGQLAQVHIKYIFLTPSCEPSVVT